MRKNIILAIFQIIDKNTQFCEATYCLGDNIDE